MRPSVVMLGIATLVVPLMVTGCASLPTRGTPAVTDEAPVATYTFLEGMGGDSGLIEGNLTFRGGCVRFKNGFVPVFADAQTSWRDGVLTFDGREYREGDRLSASGGELAGPSDQHMIPRACVDRPVVAIGPTRDLLRGRSVEPTPIPRH